ncbi:hypothetical protein ACQPYK_43280 [Streptosporangium sp. CA-135522]
MITDPREIVGYYVTGPIFLIIAGYLAWSFVEDWRNGWRPWHCDSW